MIIGMRAPVGLGGRREGQRGVVRAADGQRAVQEWLRLDGDAATATVAAAVRHTLGLLVARTPGRSVEVRIPPYAAVQCVPGPRHTRGTPPNIVETDPQTWLRLATGAMSWPEAVAAGAVRISGERATLSVYLPLVEPSGSSLANNDGDIHPTSG